MKNILILGGGFGGLAAAEHLVKILGSKHRITLVSPHEKSNELNIRCVQGEVLEIKTKHKRVKITDDACDL